MAWGEKKVCSLSGRELGRFRGFLDFGWLSTDDATILFTPAVFHMGWFADRWTDWTGYHGRSYQARFGFSFLFFFVQLLSLLPTQYSFNSYVG